MNRSGKEGHDRILAKCWDVGYDVRNGDHVRRVLHALTNGPMIGMVVTRAMREHEVRLKLPYFLDDAVSNL